MSDTSPNLDDLEGQVLAQRFKLGQLVGQGGYGAVFEAQQISVQRPCAVKVIHADFDSEYEDVLGRFRAEAIATSKLHHPNTVVIYDFGEDESRDLLFLAMEYLQGDNLGDILESHHKLDIQTTLHIINQVAASLQDAHDTGIVHRDIKPDNIMLLRRGGDENFVKVIDFGIARVLQESTRSTMERLTATGVMVGTPQYMAPEQIRDQSVDGRTDMYAVAMCVYRMLTGRTPFQGGTAVDVACQQLTDRPLPLSVYAPELDIHPNFDDVLLRALSKNMDDRFESISAFIAALNDAAGVEATWSSTGSLRAVGAKRPATNEPTPVTQTHPLSHHTREDMLAEDLAFAPTQDLNQQDVLAAAEQLVEKRRKTVPEQVNFTPPPAAAQRAPTPSAPVASEIATAPMASPGRKRLIMAVFILGGAFFIIAIVAALVVKSQGS